MTWKTDEPSEAQEDKYLLIATPKIKGEVSRVTIRVLDAEPEGTWRHWYNQRPYNCPGKAGNCPVCEVRNAAKDVDPDYRDKYRLEHVHVFNVLHDGKVKVFTFKQKVASKLREFIHEYGDLRNYDIVVKKEKNGPLDINIEWDIIFKGERPLTDEEKLVAEETYDLLAEVAPASMELLRKIANGETIQVAKREVSESAKDVVEKLGKVQEDIETATRPVTGNETFQKFVALVESKGKTLDEYGIDPANPPSDRIIKAMVKEMNDD